MINDPFFQRRGMYLHGLAKGEIRELLAGIAFQDNIPANICGQLYGYRPMSPGSLAALGADRRSPMIWRVA